MSGVEVELNDYQDHLVESTPDDGAVSSLQSTTSHTCCRDSHKMFFLESGCTGDTAARAGAAETAAPEGA